MRQSQARFCAWLFYRRFSVIAGQANAPATVDPDSSPKIPQPHFPCLRGQQMIYCRTIFFISSAARVAVRLSFSNRCDSYEACYHNQKRTPPKWVVFFFGCGGRTRTYDLRVMSPTSCQLLYSAILGCNLDCLDSIAQRNRIVNPYFLGVFGENEQFYRKRAGCSPPFSFLQT